MFHSNLAKLLLRAIEVIGIGALVFTSMSTYCQIIHSPEANLVRFLFQILVSLRT